MFQDKPMSLSPTCKRCGKCCYYLKNGIKTKCRYLMELPSGKTLCRVFNVRLYKVIDDDIKAMCVMRDELPDDFEGCPYNNGRKIKW